MECTKQKMRLLYLCRTDASLNYTLQITENRYGGRGMWEGMGSVILQEELWDLQGLQGILRSVGLQLSTLYGQTIREPGSGIGDSSAQSQQTGDTLRCLRIPQQLAFQP